MASAPHPGRLLELSGSYWQTCALHAAVKLDVFRAVGPGWLNGSRIDAAPEADERATAIMREAGVRGIERRPLDTPNDSGLLIGHK